MRRGQNKFYSLMLSLTIASMLLSSVGVSSAKAEVNGDGTDIVNENYADKLSLKPLAPAFRVETLLNWSPENDPDAELNRASVSLKNGRFKGTQVNPLANPNAGITSAGITTWNHDEASSVGSSEFNVYAFDNWQLLDSYIYWAGTNEGIFAIPTPDIVDAAHRNGVPVYATIGFPWGQSAEGVAEIAKFTRQEADGSFQVADKMIEIAEYYGFDGYFFNQETYGISKQTAERMNEMMRYIKRKSELHVSWYDSMDNNGAINYQDAINSKNDMYVKPAEDGVYAVDEFFLNYNWTSSKINTTVETMKGHNRSPFDAFAGFELQANSYNTKINTEALLDENKQAKVSIALYTPNSTMGLAKDPADFHEQERKLWTGPQGDPTLADDSADWKGMARFVTDSSVIREMPFITNFNSGHGKRYFINGKVASNQQWNNRSIQDVMPTWRWWTRHQGSRINVSYDFDTAYNGGNSLKFNGTLDAGSVNDTMLYSTKLDVTDSTKVRVIYKNPTGAAVSLGVAYSENYDQDKMKYYSLPKSGKGWNTAIVKLGKDAGKTAHGLSLKVSNKKKMDNYSIHLGQLSVYEETAKILKKPRNLKILEKMPQTAFLAEARLSWADRDNTLFYEVYQENADGVDILLGVTPNNYFYTPNISRTLENASNDNITTLKVVPINQAHVRGGAAEIAFDWGMGTDATEIENNPTSPNVALHANITDVSAENDAEPASKALDGTAIGNSKWCAVNAKTGFMTIDIGEKKSIQRWRVEHAEFGGEATNMNTVDFELLYKNDNGEWISVKRITGNTKAVTDIVLDQPVTAREFKLQIHNSGTSPWGAIRIYEWQMFESPALQRTENIMMHFVSAENNPGAKDQVTFDRVKRGETIRLYNSLDSKEALIEKTVETDGTITMNQLDFGNAEAGRIYYTVQSEDERESLKFSVAYLNEKVTKVISQINNLPDGNDLTLADKHIVNDAKVAYNKLHPKLRNQVNNYEKLVQAMERIKQLKKQS